MKKILFLFALFFFTINLTAQSIPVGSIDYMDERLRNEQLLNFNVDNSSFTIRPLLRKLDSTQNTKETNLFKFKLLPVALVQQYNSLLPLGRNDGVMIPSKGYQMKFSAGFFVSYKNLSFQFNPEYVNAENLPFEIFPNYINSSVRLNYIRYLNTYDIPDRLGSSPYKKIFWGQSSLNYRIGKVNLGISNENLWWGPGKYNSLIMSNNAPGFIHFTFNSVKPISTPIGSFEWQLISGRLVESGLDIPAEFYMVNGINYKVKKSKDWRYLSGLTLNYQPKWIPGLYLGLNRVFQLYNNDLGKGFTDYFPVISPFQKKNVTDEDGKNRDQIASLFLRWVFKESKAEIYFENGWNDHKQDFWDLLQDPSHSRAYTFGLGKIFTLESGLNKYLKFNFENTLLQQSASRIARPAGAWYQHELVLHGYTHMSQVIGAGIGPGSNAQTLDLSLWKKTDVFGIQIERYSHNLDLSHDVYTDYTIGEYNRRWVDLNFNLYVFKQIKKFGFNGRFTHSVVRNYQWQIPNNKNNFQIQLSLKYQL